VRLLHRARTPATPAQVWEVLGDPVRWPEFAPALRRVRGVHGPAAAGQTLVGISRLGSLTIPVDVLEVERASRLVLRVDVAPGVRETVTYEVVPRVGGGSDLRVRVRVDGLFAPAAIGLLWLAGGLTLRLLAVRAERIARAARQAA
jgi:uncharacterized protein YndB with AHSA1/START domain